MAELHKFKDDCQRPEDRPRAIKAQGLDDNFNTVRLKLDSKLGAVFQIVQSPGTGDVLALASNAPTSGTWVLAVDGGSLAFIETEEC